MIQVQKDKDKVLVSITTQLDREDVYQLVSDLNKWLEETLEIPKFKGIDEEAVKEAMYYSQQKRLLEEGMKEYIATIKPTQHIEKELKTIELDTLNREVEITTTKLKENARRK
jgi:predicted metal-dependent hydrolase